MECKRVSIVDASMDNMGLRFLYIITIATFMDHVLRTKHSHNYIDQEQNVFQNSELRDDCKLDNSYDRESFSMKIEQNLKDVRFNAQRLLWGTNQHCYVFLKEH